MAISQITIRRLSKSEPWIASWNVCLTFCSINFMVSGAIFFQKLFGRIAWTRRRPQVPPRSGCGPAFPDVTAPRVLLVFRTQAGGREGSGLGFFHPLRCAATGTGCALRAADAVLWSRRTLLDLLGHLFRRCHRSSPSWKQQREHRINRFMRILI